MTSKLLFSKLSYPSSLSLSSQKSCLIPLIILMSPLYSLQQLQVLLLLGRGAGGSSAGEVSTEQGRRAECPPPLLSTVGHEPRSQEFGVPTHTAGVCPASHPPPKSLLAMLLHPFIPSLD